MVDMARRIPSMYRKGSHRSMGSSSQRENPKKARKHDKSPSHADGGEPTHSASHTTTVHSPSMPSTSRDEVNAPPWDMVLSALPEL